jgi:hypothetical protein
MSTSTRSSKHHDPQTARLRALLVRLRSARSVDTDMAGWNPKDLFRVTSTKLTDTCKDLLAVCDERPFRKQLRQLELVLRRNTYSDYFPTKNQPAGMLTNRDNLRLVGLIFRDMWQHIASYARELTVIPSSNHDDADMHNVLLKLASMQTSAARALSAYCTLQQEYLTKHTDECHTYTYLKEAEAKRLYDTMPAV